MEPTEKAIFFVGDWRVSPLEGVVSREAESVRLEPKAVEVLVYLASRPGEVVSRDELEKAVWRGALVGYEAVTKTVIKLRKALGDNAREPRYIETIPKRGYQLIAPVRRPPTEDAAAESPPDREAASTGLTNGGRSKRWLTIPALLALALVAALAYWLLEATPTTDQAPPSIIVLPFENLGDTGQTFTFADGITEDIITDLSGVAGLRVLASNTAFAFKGKKVSASELNEKLGVDFFLEGSLRRHDDSIRVNVQLVDARSGYQKWAQRYDRELAEVFAVQDEVTNNIVDALTIRLSPQEEKRLANRTTNNLAAYDDFQEGQRLSKVSTRETNYQAEAAYRKAIAEDPDYGRAYGALAYTLAFRYRRGWSDSPVATIDLARDLAEKAVRLDDAIPQTHWALGYVYLMRKEYGKAEAATTQAVTIAPNYADGYGLLALIKNALGKSDDAIRLIRKGMELNPYYTWDYPYNLGRAYYTAGEIDAAIPLLEEARTRNQNAIPIRLHLAACYARAGRLDDAEWEVEEIQTLSPSESISLLKATHPIDNPEDMRVLLEDLRQAGLPE